MPWHGWCVVHIGFTAWGGQCSRASLRVLRSEVLWTGIPSNLFVTLPFPQPFVERVLSDLGLPATSPLSVLAVELIPEITLRSQADAPRRDPLGESLGEVRILRTSPLAPVPPIC